MRSMYQRSSWWECMSAESPVTIAALIGAPVSGLYRASENACTMAAVACGLSGSWGWNADPQAEWSCTIIGSMRPGDCASMTWRSER